VCSINTFYFNFSLLFILYFIYRSNFMNLAGNELLVDVNQTSVIDIYIGLTSKISCCKSQKVVSKME